MPPFTIPSCAKCLSCVRAFCFKITDIFVSEQLDCVIHHTSVI